LKSAVVSPVSKFTRYSPDLDRLLNIRKDCTRAVREFSL
jgi:hypothetical protein